MDPFNRDAHCPKCGDRRIRSQYQAKRDRIERTCDNCSYSWFEQPLDGGQAGGEDKAARDHDPHVSTFSTSGPAVENVRKAWAEGQISEKEAMQKIKELESVRQTAPPTTTRPAGADFECPACGRHTQLYITEGTFTCKCGHRVRMDDVAFGWLDEQLSAYGASSTLVYLFAAAVIPCATPVLLILGLYGAFTIKARRGRNNAIALVCWCLLVVGVCLFIPGLRKLILSAILAFM